MFVTVTTLLSEKHNISIPVSLKMEAVCFSATPVGTHNTKRCHNPRTQMILHRNLPGQTWRLVKSVTTTHSLNPYYLGRPTVHSMRYASHTRRYGSGLFCLREILSCTTHRANHEFQQGRLRTYNATLRNVRVTIVAVSVALVIQHAMRMCRIILPSVASLVAPHILHIISQMARF